MSEEFKRQNVIDNLMILVQNSNMKVGEIEKKLGVSPGYLSRLAKKDNDSALSAELLWKISHLFGVSVDTLVNEKIGQEDKGIAYMRRFISRLTAKTSNGELIWKPITISEINAMLMGNKRVQFPVAYYENADFPKEKPAPADDPIQVDYALACYGEMKVVSAVFGGMIVNPQESVYYVSLGDGEDVKDLYLAHYCTWGENGSEEFYELMLVDPFSEDSWWAHQDSEYHSVNGKDEIPNYVEEVCNTFSYIWQPVSSEMKDLFRTVKRHEDDIQLPVSVKSTIDRFMDEDLG